MVNQTLYSDEIGYMLFCFALFEKEEYIRIYEETQSEFWDLSWTKYFDEVNKVPNMPKYTKPYSVIYSIQMFSDEFSYEDINGKYCNCKILGDVINSNVFPWIKNVENLDRAVFLGLLSNGIPLDVSPPDGWREITPLFLRKYGKEAKKLIEKEKNIKQRSWKNYSEYLRTDHWQSQRKAALKRAEFRCQVCNSGDKQLDVHHRTYERLGVEIPADLIVLCNDCHTLFHKNSKLKRI